VNRRRQSTRPGPAANRLAEGEAGRCPPIHVATSQPYQNTHRAVFGAPLFLFLLTHASFAFERHQSGY
ncbi:MAG: hypothetical protein OXC57_11665, partial [Rhodobacteraceae bacterium]|nr:hypothetical protein [Paracoccaceae bacterium]